MEGGESITLPPKDDKDQAKQPEVSYYSKYNYAVQVQLGLF